MNIFLFQTLLRHWSNLYLVHHQRVFFCPVVQQQFTERQIVNDGRNMEAGSASVVWSIHCIRGVLPLKQVLYHILKNNEIYVTIAGIFNCIKKENPNGFCTLITRDSYICNWVSIQFTATQNVPCSSYILLWQSIALWRWVF